MLGVTCQLCSKRPATTHLTELDPFTGQRQELHICAHCIQRLNLKLENGPPPIAEILGMRPDDVSSAKIKVIPNVSSQTLAPPKPETTCPHCGLAFTEFGSGKLFGCAHDYSAFGDKIAALLQNYHGSSHHVGRVPGSARAQDKAAQDNTAHDDAITNRRARLDAALRDAIVAENYENAAKIRDELKRLDQPARD
jgi:protein arginine kinase activator